jgi:hypothetical protein
MGNFLYNVEKSRKEWLKKPNPIPTRARYLNANLNANLNASLVEEVVVVVVDAQSESKLESNSNQDPKLETE